MDDFEIELKHDFLQEAKELVENTEQSFLELERDPSNGALIDAIFRFAHNLKGTSRAVGFGQIAELTHVAENLLLDIKQGKLKVSEPVVSSLLLFNDKVKDMIAGFSQNLDTVFDIGGLVAQLEAVSKGQELETAVEEAVVAPSSQDFPEEQVVEVEAESAVAVQEETHVTPIREKAPEVKKEPRKDDETIRVSLNRLERLNNMVGELVILQSLVEGSLSRAGDSKTARALGKLCSDIQDLSMSLRMVPVGPTFQKLTRVVRDTSRTLGKKVNLTLLGEDTEIDKTVAESLGDPLVHIIRNAIDHGCEMPETRLERGKSEEGSVEVMAFHEGNFLIIQITDDGNGIDAEKLTRKAKEKGIIPQSAQLSEQQGVELIFHPGFSSKEVVSEVSGRGVGMDVVKSNIEALGGEVKVRSKLGSGSCFRLMLPLTMAIIDGLLVESLGQTFIVPKTQVQEVYQIDKTTITQMTGRTPYLVIRDEIIPLFHLENDVL